MGNQAMIAPRIFTREYYARMRDLESGGWWNAGMRDVAAMLLQDAELPASGTLLDIGCGSGQTMAWFLEEHPGWSAIGIDIAPDGVAAARFLGLENVLLASALDLPLASEAMDLAVTLDVLQHLPLDGGDNTALREMHRVLKPGGHLFLRTNAQAFPRTSDDREFNFHKFQAEELQAKLEDAGFTVVRLSRLNAVLGLAEIPRELRATRSGGAGYHGILAQPSTSRSLGAAMKRGWLCLEGQAVRRGWRLPVGRTIVALCRA
jgi:SAM-dependent methyltransferase